ncbi:hypothetical protein GLW08_18910 [Pontibacillus yanchengensis]|uniref:Uncharacterized protein n=2 Tax=Pontibacillus yanchengensis TaxID=462910 RepID=A0ACC7VL02_9BACI|nr:hypothetical protein [Pontibacillus yanchengensis]MYL33715.1 hypothetical protein [Pontibacillus yanchengensis]MYL55387.1 hypothetical protein [Pontibacillus yanchengensis]
MNAKELYAWLDRVEKRNDLGPLLHDRSLVVSFYSNCEQICLEIENGKCLLHDIKGRNVQVIVEADSYTLQLIWSGEIKLLKVPKHLIKMNGRYKDVLLIEALFHLSA